MLFKLDEDGSVLEMLLYPETKLAWCARESLVKDHFGILPPRADYWVSVYMKAEVNKSPASRFSRYLLYATKAASKT